MRKTISLDGTWKILPPKVSHEAFVYEKELEFGFQGIDVDTGMWDDITVPSYWHIVYPETCPLPPEQNYWYSAVAHDQYVSSWYRTTFTLSDDISGKRVVLRFNQVGYEAHVWINGREVGEHKGSFTAFDFDITDYVVSGDNVLAVWVYNDFGTNPPTHTYGKMFSSWSNVGGIVGSVSLHILPETYIRKVLCSPSVDKQHIDMDLEIFRAQDGDGVYQISAHYRRMLYGKPCGEKLRVDLGAATIERGNNSLKVVLPVKSPALWSLDMPNVYEITLELYRKGDQVDSLAVKTGFRNFVASGGRFYLNGERIRLYCGNITTGPRGAGLRDFIKMQKKYNVNTIRYHMAGGSQLIDDLEICDEEGILVINEFPWFHRVFEVLPEGEALEIFTANVASDMTDWVEQNHNNPSVIMWCLSNEAWNNSVVKPLDVLYEVVKQTDRQKRLVSSGSGMHCYGMPDIPMKTDVFDDHNYTVNMEVPWSLLPEVFEARYRIFENIYGEVTKPWVTLEFTAYGFKSLKQLIERDRDIMPEEYIKLANSVDIQTLGLRAQVQNKGWYNLLVEKLSKETIEQLRLETRIQGVHPWFRNREHLPEALKVIYNPTFVGLSKIVKSYFDGKPFDIEIAVVDDRLKGITGTIDVRLSCGNEVIAQTECEVRLSPGQEIATFGCTVPVRRIGHTALCLLTLTLKSESGELINTNSYDIFCMSDENSRFEPLTAGKAAIVVPESRQEGWMSVFADLGIDVTPIDTLEHLEEYQYLFICSLQDEDRELIGLLRDNSRKLRDWIWQGGHVVCLEWAANVEIPWLQDYKVVCNSSTKSTFVDLIVPEHSLFKNIPPEALDSWLGLRNLVVESMIMPLTANALAASASFTEHGVLSTVVEGCLGAGYVLLSTIMAHKRYGLDAVATVFLKNTLAYVLQKHERIVREFPLRRESLHARKISQLTAGDIVVFRGQSQSGFDELLREALNATETISGLDTSWRGFLETQLEGTSFNMCDLVCSSLAEAPALRGEDETLSMKSVPGVKVSRFILVHAGNNLAQPVAARYRVKYADGTQESIPVRVGAEIDEVFSESDVTDNADRMKVDINEGLSINLYLTVWDNSYPEKIVSEVVLNTVGKSSVACLGVAGVRSVEWGADVRGREWNFSSPDDIGLVKDIDRIRFDSAGLSGVMGSHNPRFSLDLGGKVINARQFSMMHIRYYCSEPHRIGIVFKTVEGIEGQAYIAVNKGWGEYQVDLRQEEFQQIGSSPSGATRIGWGGETSRIAELSIVPGNRTGVEFAVGWIRLFGEGALKTVWYE